ncbi:retrovirus-related Pol polyprotein from transposon TNT 1-94 [Lycium ferocissimum]|uniref:retrovirus-related Pol polyprotein from transposon TNT 1-94 n=1 Tax=Lycium ferocissimum TaxID=112874 RepID=UPI002815DD91|nr:retrovirus-related Pol polyprotein from transposon TNT 1-94 [Lycium ferocissimum]
MSSIRTILGLIASLDLEIERMDVKTAFLHGKNASRIDELKKQLSKSFAMKDLGHAKQILGMRITRSRDERKLYLSQERYIERVLERFNMKNAKWVSTPLPGHRNEQRDVSYNNGGKRENGQDSLFLCRRKFDISRKSRKKALGSCEVDTQSKLQKCVALSTTEAEYIAATEAGKEMIWLEIPSRTWIAANGVYCLLRRSSAIDLSKKLDVPCENKTH